MSELLFEVLSGEIPYAAQAPAAKFLSEFIFKKMQTFCNIEQENIHAYYTPRRISVLIENFDLKTQSDTQIIKGPKIDAPPQAINGFMAKYSLQMDELFQEGDYFYAKISDDITDPKKAIAQILLDAMKSLVWPKSLFWNDSMQTWIRPIHSILAILDGQILDFEYANIKASNNTIGNRSHNEILSINSIEEYKKSMIQCNVILDVQRRKQSILQQAQKLIDGMNIQIIQDDKLLTEIACLVEYPVVFLAKIKEEFLSLPKEILILTLKSHQRYLMLEDENSNIAGYHFIVANIQPNDEGAAIIHGNSTVACARLYDAKFFFENDLSKTLPHNIPLLKDLTYHKDFGSYLDKQSITKTLGLELGQSVGYSDLKNIESAVELSKADLVTSIVKEMPELQGIMGYYYALASNIDKEIAIAICDHYKPQGPNDVLPRNTLGCIVAIADKLSSLSIMFSLGIKPTSTKDPFGLRRAAIGILRIISENNWDIDLNKLSLTPEVVSFIYSKAPKN